VPIFSVNSWSAGSPHVPSRNLRRFLGRSLTLVCLLAPVLPTVPLVAQDVPAQAAPAASSQQTVVGIHVIGTRRIPQDTVKARMFSKIGEPFDPLSVERDFNSLWNTGYFEDVRIEKEDTAQGIILDVYVSKKRRSASPKRASTIPRASPTPSPSLSRCSPSTATSSPTSAPK
jgi:outer membrane protein insertion porin family